MSKKSIDSKIQGLEDRLRIERNREDTRFTINMTTTRNRPHLPDLPIYAMRPRDVETDNKLKEIYTMSGKLNIEGALYQSEIRDLEQLGELGSGTCGHVVKMLHNPSQSIIAVKQMRRSGNSEENKRILMDLDVVLRSHGCPYIVKCLGCFITDADVWICMELMASCFDKLLKRLSKPIPEEILGKVTVATVSALSYLKDAHGVIHRDVKPSNILIDERGNVKLCDFGISGRLVDSKAKTRSAGCAAYMAPERIDPPDPLKPDYDIRADVWSLGISLVELATGIFPYRDCQTDFEVLTKVIEEDPPSLPDSQPFSSEFKSFVQQCLTKNYRHRPKYTKLLEHPFVKKSLGASVRVDEWYLGIEGSPQPVAAPQARSVSPPPVCRIFTNQNSTEKPNKTKIMPAEITADATDAPDETPSDSPSPNNNVCSDEDNTSVTTHARSPARDAGFAFAASGHPFESGSYGSMNIDNDSDPADATMSSAENLSSVKSIGRMVSAESEPANGRMILWNNVGQAKDKHGSPKDYYAPHRFRSHSNSMQPPQTTAHWPLAGSPNSKMNYSNAESRGNPFTNGTRFPPFKTGPEVGDFHDYRRYGSPEVSRRQVFAHTNPFRTSQDSATDSQHFIPLHGYDNEGSPSAERPPVPQFRAQGPTNYFTATAACSNLRFGPPAGSYHYSPGGSYSQPASLEGCTDTRNNFSPYTRRRTLEQCMSPPPRPGGLERRRPVPAPPSSLPPANVMDQQRTQLRHGNTSPIVLQRFYHQQSQQRRSRADLCDVSVRHRSLSRDHSSGRSPEPPPRTSRDSGGSRLHLVEGQTDLLQQRLESDPRIPRYNQNHSLDCDYPQERNGSHIHTPLFSQDKRNDAVISTNLGRSDSERNSSLTRCFDGRSSRDREKWEANGDCDLSHNNSYSHKKSHKDKDEQGWLNSIAGIVKRRFTSYMKLHLGTNNGNGANRSASPSRLMGGHFTRTHRSRHDTQHLDDIKLKLQQQRDSGPSILTRYGCATPQPCRVRLPFAMCDSLAGSSRSVPASPRPSPRPAPLANLLRHPPD